MRECIVGIKKKEFAKYLWARWDDEPSTIDTPLVLRVTATCLTRSWTGRVDAERCKEGEGKGKIASSVRVYRAMRLEREWLVARVSGVKKKKTKETSVIEG